MTSYPIQNLMTKPGLQNLAAQLGSVSSFYNQPQTIAQIPSVVSQFVTRNPELQKLKYVITPQTPGLYNPSTGTIAIGAINPVVIGHELSHASVLSSPSLYSKILNFTSAAAALNRIIALPTMLAIRALIGDEARRKKVFNILSGVSAALALPSLVEEARASADAVRSAPDKLRGIATVLPAFLLHAASQALPVGIYQLGKL